MIPAYTDTEWDADFRAVFVRRTGPPSCPGCQRTGFFGPRKAHDRRYRLCKFCGAYQAIAGQPMQCVATVHGCPPWPLVAGTPYIWWVQPTETRYDCPYCGASVPVSAVTVKRPIEDPTHPWWSVPQSMSFAEAAGFWIRHGQARIYL